MARVGFIGTGEIAAALVRGPPGQGHKLLVSPRNAALAARPAAQVDGVTVAANDLWKAARLQDRPSATATKER